MAAAVSMSFEVAPEGVAAMAASLASVCDALGSSRDAREHAITKLPALFQAGGDDRIVILSEGIGALCADNIECAARGAGDGYVLTLLPSQWYEELVAAIAGDRETETRHGWPILPVAVRTTTVTEGAATGNRAAPEGRA